MAYRNYADLRSSRTEYTRVLPNAKYGFRGVDFSSSPHQIELYRMPDARNVYRDYRSDEGGAVETIPGFRRLSSFTGEEIFGIHRFDDKAGNIYLACHAGDALYIGKEALRDELASKDLWKKATGTLNKAPSRSFVYNGVFYILDGKTYQKLSVDDSSGTPVYTLQAATDTAYRPKVWLYGEQHEQRNLLTDVYTATVKGSEGVTAVETTSDDFTGSQNTAKYVGANTFVLSHLMSTGRFENRGVACLVFASSPSVNLLKREKTSAIEQKDTSLKHLMLWARGDDLIEHTVSFEAFGALKNIYFRSDKNSSGDYYKILMNSGEELKMPNGGCVYFNFPIEDVSEVFPEVSGISTYTQNYLENAFNAFPANMVIRAGDKATYDMGLDKHSAHGFSAASFSIRASDEIVTNIDEYTVSKIYIHTQTNKDGVNEAVVEVGENVKKGRYYYYGYHINSSAGVDRWVLFCIDVLPAQQYDGDGKPVKDDVVVYPPAQYVFDYTAEPVTFMLPEKSQSVESVTDGEYDAGFGCIYDGEGNIEAVGALVRTAENDVDICAVATDFHIVSGNASVFEGNEDYEGTGEEAVNGCTLCAVYDDRVFLSGNPALPNTVFYSQRNDMGVTDPTYFGVLNYVNDGVGWEPITGMFTFSDTLCVTKRDTVYYHAGADGNDVVTRIYPSVRGNTGLGSLGACCNFLDDPVMLTREGVWGVNKETLTLERTLGRRSSVVDARLLREQELHKAEMVEWEGYLCLFINGNVYMADSRATHSGDTGTEYEWFYLEGVGTHKGEDGLRHPYYAAVTGEPITEEGISLIGKSVSVDGEEYELTETHDVLIFTDGEVFDVPVDLNGDGETADSERVPVAVRDGRAYLVYVTAEYEKSGTFHAGIHPLVVENRLYFGDDLGNLFVFNNDKRGVAVGDEEMPPSMIHRSFYSFDGERIDSGFATRLDNCDIPHLTKSTSPRSMTVRVKLLDGAAYTVSVYTEKNPTYKEVFASSPVTFGGADFGSTAYYAGKGAQMVGRERERQWVEKQYLLRDGGFERPMAIYDISYRYRVAGRIRD